MAALAETVLTGTAALAVTFARMRFSSGDTMSVKLKSVLVTTRSVTVGGTRGPDMMRAVPSVHHDSPRREDQYM